VQRDCVDIVGAAKMRPLRGEIGCAALGRAIKAAVGDPPPAQGKGGRGGPGFASFTDVVYQELTKK